MLGVKLPLCGCGAPEWLAGHAAECQSQPLQGWDGREVDVRRPNKQIVPFDFIGLAGVPPMSFNWPVLTMGRYLLSHYWSDPTTVCADKFPCDNKKLVGP